MSVHNLCSVPKERAHELDHTKFVILASRFTCEHAQGALPWARSLIPSLNDTTIPQSERSRRVHRQIA